MSAYSPTATQKRTPRKAGRATADIAVGLATEVPTVVTRKDFPANNLAEFIALRSRGQRSTRQRWSSDALVLHAAAIAARGPNRTHSLSRGFAGNVRSYGQSGRFQLNFVERCHFVNSELGIEGNRNREPTAPTCRRPLKAVFTNSSSRPGTRPLRPRGYRRRCWSSSTMH